ncbi:LuxR C-terminal-related transcriptional regulator [Pseudorhodoferax sp. Leaf265]|uniref:helix-turn-helix transcriptional regulator n=1 Tax=Pseudorhodoferax sp. Leaf265 TaxID=1736315 RepID=UPI0006FC927E|nr:LuxR C-terminal-related transcriptional regulator [Pseudorhodoferax sp. Leaf265]KQP19353.1 hypothetical protein ASF45_25055 [Pseudorhodoferax sp. Leaf265]
MFVETETTAVTAGAVSVREAGFLDRRLRDAILDAIDAGVIICSSQGHVLFSNLAARQEVSSGRLLRMVNAKLDGVGTSGLGSALTAAAAKGTRHIVELRTGDDRLHAVVSPLRSSTGERIVIVLLGRRSSSSELSIELLGINAGLTSAERQVLADMAAQRKPSRIAHERQVTIATVRTQIASLYAKLGVRSQQELMCLLGGVPPLAMKHFSW